jgi:hypothetical protein
VIGRGGTAIACWSRNTKLPELGFHAVVGDGTRELHFERLFTRQGFWERRQMLLWAAHYSTRRSENPRILPSQAWADVVALRRAGDHRPGRPRAPDSIAVVGAVEADYEGDI